MSSGVANEMFEAAYKELLTTGYVGMDLGARKNERSAVAIMARTQHAYRVIDVYDFEALCTEVLMGVIRDILNRKRRERRQRRRRRRNA